MKATIGRYLSLATAGVLLTGAIGICEAKSVVVSAQTFPGGTVLYTPEINPVDATSCGKQTVAAAPEIIVKGVTYQFLFWNINAKAYATASVTFQPVCGSANSASAWYWPICTATVDCPGPAPTTDSVVAFSLNDNKVISGTTPIESAMGGDWKPGSTVVTPPAKIEALADIGGYGLFTSWEVLPKPVLTTSRDLTLEIPGEVAVAFYGFPDPDPCQPIRNEIAGGCSDAPSATACSALLKELHAQLTTCEKAYGELPLP